MFGRNPRSPAEIIVVQDSSSVPEEPEELVDELVSDRASCMEQTHQQVLFIATFYEPLLSGQGVVLNLIN